jgi:RNA polymerase sigma-70 factor, ECF subfamily
MDGHPADVRGVIQVPHPICGEHDPLERPPLPEDQRHVRNSPPGGTSNSADTELILRSIAGDAEAFRLIVERYQNQVAATVIGMLGHGPETDDIGQETFIRLYRSLPRIRGESALGTYLTRIAINLCFDSLRRKKRQQLWFRLDREDDPLPPELIVEDGHRIEDSEKRRWIQKAIRSLDPKHRAVVVLRMVAGYSTKETAELLDVPIGTVLSRLSRAQDKLRVTLSPLIEE